MGHLWSHRPVPSWYWCDRQVLSLPFFSASHSASVFCQSSEINFCSLLNSGTELSSPPLFPRGCVPLFLAIYHPCFCLFKWSFKVTAYEVEHPYGLEYNCVVPMVCCEILVFSLPRYAAGEAWLLQLLFLTVTFLRFYYLSFLNSFFVNINTCLWTAYEGFPLWVSFLALAFAIWLSFTTSFLFTGFVSLCSFPANHILEAELSSGGGLALEGVEHIWNVIAPYFYTPHTWSGIHTD